ncbi:MAG TPA: prepilin-type N-terminal cleavage/methylation domain-containing protein [Patescibacteria group bacterium]|nr:prepilin-type N-terminal cleavage/methylation domain-containing protein [Patescibacteria group bacterium]
MNKNQKGFALFEVLFFILLIAVLIGVAYYIGTKHDNKISTAAKSSQDTKSTTSNTTTNQSLFKFTNLGVQFKLPSSLSDLLYTPQTTTDGSIGGYLSTTAIEKLINNCQTDQTNDTETLSIAGLDKINGQYDPGQIIESTLLKQFSTFSIAISYPNGINPCYPNQNAMDQLKSQEHSTTEAFIKAFQSSAVEIK